MRAVRESGSADDVLRALLESRVPLSFTSGEWRETVVHAAARHQPEIVMNALLASLGPAQAAAARSARGETPLHVAAEVGSVDVMRMLMSGGADVGARRSDNAFTPLHAAARDVRPGCTVAVAMGPAG